MRAFRFHGLGFIVLLMTAAGCKSSAQQSDGAAEARADTSADTSIDSTDAIDGGDAVDSTDAIDGGDAVVRDALDFDASVSCSAKTCGPGEICVHEKGGFDASPPEDNCYPLPARCAGVPTCDCIAGLNGVSARCGMSCDQLGDREFMCMGF